MNKSAGCFWCGGNGCLETYTAAGDVEESTECVCVLRERVAVLTRDLIGERQLLSDANDELVRLSMFPRCNESCLVRERADG